MMSSATIANALMTGTTLLVAGGGGLRYLLGRKTQARKDDTEDAKGQGEVALTESQKQEVNELAESAYDTRRIGIEKWWLEQFQLVQKQLGAERDTNESRWRRLRKAIRVHAVWDEEQVTEAIAQGRHPRPAPSLDPDDYEDDERDQ